MTDTERDKDKERDKGQRRVYMFPAELVDRITKFQHDVGYASEVEAVRRLLDSALKSRDKPDDLIYRFLERRKETKDLAEIAKDTLVGHPLVASLKFGDDEIEFSFKQGGTYSITTAGKVLVSRNGAWKPYQGRGLVLDDNLDDDIPF